jgi:hypothetical protein
VREQRPHRLATAPGDRRGGRRADEPAERGAGEGRGQRLEEQDEPGLPAGHPGRAKPPEQRLRVRPPARCHQHREREQQRHRLAAEQEQAAARDTRRVGRREQLVRRCGQLEAEARALEGRARLLDPRREGTGRPRAHRASTQGNDPAVAAVGVVQHRRAVEGGDPVCQHERRRRGPVVAADLLDEGRLAEVLRRDRVAEQRRRAEAALADGHEPQAWHVRDRPAAPDDQDLAVLRPAHPRQAARAQVHPAAEVVDRGEAEQRAAELVLPVERGAGRGLRERAGELPPHGPVEGRVGRDLAADAEPVDADRAHLGGQLRDLTRHLAVLGGRRPGQHGREHRRRGREPEHDEHERLAAPAQPYARQPAGKPELAHHRGERCQRRGPPSTRSAEMGRSAH